MQLISFTKSQINYKQTTVFSVVCSSFL